MNLRTLAVLCLAFFVTPQLAFAVQGVAVAGSYLNTDYADDVARLVRDPGH
jgi:hypothetical protein